MSKPKPINTPAEFEVLRSIAMAGMAIQYFLFIGRTETDLDAALREYGRPKNKARRSA
jgi:hypothetical protein